VKTDLRDVMLEATARAQKLLMEFQKQIAMPMMKGKMAEMWQTLPDEMKERFAKEKPNEYHALMEALKA
jgi:hypothetical protein